MSSNWIKTERTKVENLDRDKLLEEYTKLLQDYTIVAEELEQLRKFFTSAETNPRQREGKEL